jgi:hypothetical protein
MNDHSTITTLALAPSVRFEPCVGFHADAGLDVCAGCGWPADDHDAPAQILTTRHRRERSERRCSPASERPRAGYPGPQRASA